jgi:hypothetical protein
MNTTIIKSWRDVLLVHPAADEFPRMSETELRELGADIKKNGLKSPIALWKNQKHFPPVLLDGRSRLDAMEGAGIELRLESCGTDSDPQLKLWSRRAKTDMWIPVDMIELRGDQADGDPYTYVASANIHRRHLTAEKKRELIGKLLEADPTKSDTAIGEQARVSKNTVAKVRAEKERRGQIDHVETRTDTKGRKQPAKKQKKPPSEVDKPEGDVCHRITYAADAGTRTQEPVTVAAATTIEPSNEPQARRLAVKKREIMSVEIERLASRLISNDRESARQLYKLLWDDAKGSVFRLTCALRRGLGIDDAADEAVPPVRAAPDDGLEIPDFLRRAPEDATVP